MKSFLLVAFACCATCLYSISVRAGDLAFDEAGNLFVVDQALTDLGTDPVTKSWLGRSIVKITPDGAKSTFATGLEEPRDLTVDATGNVYVPSNYAILRFTPDGTKNT